MHTLIYTDHVILVLQMRHNANQLCVYVAACLCVLVTTSTAAAFDSMIPHQHC
jgi:hypothetical protein